MNATPPRYLRVQQGICEDIADAKGRSPEVTWWIGVCLRFCGHGDWLVACALARAARRKWTQRLGLPDEAIGVIVIGTDMGAPESIDISAGQPGITWALRLRIGHWLPRAEAAALMFDVFYSGLYAIREQFSQLSNGDAQWWQMEADQRLAPYRRYLDSFPNDNYDLGRTGLSQWHVMAASSGLDVTPDDLFIATEPPHQAGYEVADTATLDALAGCVTIHNGQGEFRGTKTLPQDVLDAISAACIANGHRVVQLGMLDNQAEPPVMGAADVRGLRINESARVIQRARLHVDSEGGLVHVARAVRTRSVGFFGPTPPGLFGYDGNVNYTRGICPEDVCGPHCFWHTWTWSHRCELGFECCVNHPQPATAARVVLDALNVAQPPSAVKES